MCPANLFCSVSVPLRQPLPHTPFRSEEDGEPLVGLVL